MNSSDNIDRNASGRADTRVIAGDPKRTGTVSSVRALIIVAHNRRRKTGLLVARTCLVTQLPPSARLMQRNPTLVKSFAEL